MLISSSTFLLLLGAAVAPDSGAICRSEIARALTQLDSIIRTFEQPQLRSSADTSDSIRPIKLDEHRLLSACPPRYRPNATLWNRIFVIYSELSSRSVRRSASATTGGSSAPDTLVVRIERPQPTLRSFPLDSLIRQLSAGQVRDSAASVARAEALQACSGNKGSLNTLVEDLQIRLSNCIAASTKLALQTINEQRYAELRHIDSALAILRNVSAEDGRDSLVVRLVRGASRGNTTTETFDSTVDQTQIHIATGLREDLAALARDLELATDRRPAIVTFLASGALDHIGAGLLLRVSAPTWNDRRPFVFSLASYPSGAPSRQAGELSAGTLNGDWALLVGGIIRGNPQPLGAAVTALYLPNRRVPAVGVRVSTTDRLGLLVGWGY